MQANALLLPEGKCPSNPVGEDPYELAEKFFRTCITCLESCRKTSEQRYAGYFDSAFRMCEYGLEASGVMRRPQSTEHSIHCLAICLRLGVERGILTPKQLPQTLQLELFG